MHNMRPNRRAFLKKGAAATVGISTLAGCAGGNDTGEAKTTAGASDVTATVGSKRFTEQELYSWASIIALRERTKAKIRNEIDLGGTSQIWRAFKNGNIDHYWSYTVTQWNQIHGKDSVIADPDKIYRKTKNLIENQYDGISVLDPTSVRADWTIVARPDWAQKHGIKTISDFAEYIKSGHTDITFVTYSEFAARADGIPALLDTYNISQETWDAVEVKKVAYGGLNYQILNAGDAVATSGWLTQPQIYQYDLQPLKDDKGFTSASVVIPLVRDEILEGNESVKTTINDVAASFTTEGIQAKVLKIANTDKSAQEVAREHLLANQVI